MAAERRSTFLGFFLCLIHAKLLREMGEQLVYTVLLLPKDVVQALVHLIPVLLDEPLHSLLMQPLVQRRVLSVDEDLAIGKGQALHRFLVEDDVQRDLLARLRK